MTTTVTDISQNAFGQALYMYQATVTVSYDYRGTHTPLREQQSELQTYEQTYNSKSDSWSYVNRSHDGSGLTRRLRHCRLFHAEHRHILGAKNTAVNTAHQQARTAMLQMIQDLHSAVSLPALSDVNHVPLVNPAPNTAAPGISFQLWSTGP